MICNKIELLAPAGNLSIGCAAIDAGADAVYIGGPSLSARRAASNSIEDITLLCHYAHQFGAKVYLAINTLLEPDELSSARDMVIQAHRAGVDAFIVQDMAFLDMDFGFSVVLHASTQCANRTVERVLELQRAGFERVVLERGLSIGQIREIGSSCDVELEAFVHGAICISYSGECYLSEKLCQRSANRGDCAQPCRSLYDLVDSQGNTLLRREALLSPKDLNLSERLGELIQAGVHSLKIEGRLKDERYVVGTVAYYNQKLEALGVARTSYGRSKALFTPDLMKSFTRGFTQYFFDGRVAEVMTKGTPKGKYMGRIKMVGDKYFTLDRGHDLSNGDGVALGSGGGGRINRVEEARIYPLSMEGIHVGESVYGTHFENFKPRSIRKIEVSITLSDNALTLSDGYGQSFSMPLPDDLDRAQNADKARENLRLGLSKSGDTIFDVVGVEIQGDDLPFVPNARLNTIRRELFSLYHTPKDSVIDQSEPMQRVKASNPEIPSAHLTTTLCPLFQYGLCLKTNKLALPLTLVNQSRRIRFEPHCDRCELRLYVL